MAATEADLFLYVEMLVKAWRLLPCVFLYIGP